jgi:Carboxypeptidase regulatory-like domain/TonB dependent receptor/TonB-dependent Receptor Plug Domain
MTRAGRLTAVWLRVFLLMFLFGAMAVTPSAAQQGTAELKGTVVDQQGAALPGVAVVVRNQDTGMFRETHSTEDGAYFVTSMVPGTYEVTAQLAGFKTVNRKDVRLEIGKTTTLEIRLDVGGLEEVVNVSAESPLVDVTSKEVGGNIKNEELINLPSINRNFIGFIGLLPGVVPNISTESFGSDSVNVNGGDDRNNNYMLDGSNNNDDVIGQRAGTQARTPLESIQEFQVLTNQFDAEFGRTNGAVINAVTKQGTNAWTGSAFVYAQDADWTAKDYFTKQNNLSKPDTKQQQFGGTFGGPIVRNKAHFFVSVERVLIDMGISINIQARPELNATTTTETRVWNSVGRFDHQLGPNHTWGVRWLREYSPQFNQIIPVVLADGRNLAVTLAGAREEDDLDQTVVGNLSSVFGNTRVNTLRVAFTQEDVAFANPGFNSNGRRQDLLPPALYYLTFADQQSALAQARINNAYQVEDTFSWFVPGKGGDHDIKVGAQFQYSSNDFRSQDNFNGTFSFANNGPFNPTDPRSYPERLSIRVPGPLAYFMKATYFSAFAQDKWKLNNRLTLSLGLRYDLEDVPIRELDNPEFSDANDYPLDTNNVSPRVGFAYDIENGRSVIRGGYGTFYDKTHFELITGLITNGVFSNSFETLFPRNNADPGPSSGRLPDDPMLVNGPTVNRELLAQMFPAGSQIKNTGTVVLDSPNRRIPYNHQITVGYERQLWPQVSVGVDYVRVMGRDLFMTRDLNPGLRDTPARTSTFRRINPAFAGAVKSSRERRTDRLRRTAAPGREALQLELQPACVVHPIVRPWKYDRHWRTDERVSVVRRHESRSQRRADERRSTAQPRGERHVARAKDWRPLRQLRRARAQRRADDADGLDNGS